MRPIEVLDKEYIIWTGTKGLDETVLNEVGSSLEITDELEQQIERARKEIEEDPGRRVGKLWRFESSEDRQSGLFVNASHTDYGVHYVLREVKNKQRDFYALPIGVNPLLEVKDGIDRYIVLGLIDEHSDHPGLALAGSRFIYRADDGSKPDETIKDAIKRGVTTKTTISEENIARHLGLSRVIGLVYAESTHDVGIVTYVPMEGLTTNEIRPAGNYDRVFFMPKHLSAINELIRTGQYEGFPATEQLRRSLFIYQHQRALGNLQ